MRNIIYILLDQVRKDMLGPYGHSIVKTPNIDKLAKEEFVLIMLLRLHLYADRQEPLYSQD